MPDIHIHIHEGGEPVQTATRRATKSSGKRSPAPAKKRAPSTYQKEYGRQFKALKKKHPKTSFKNLSARAHKATKKKLK